MRAKHIQKAKHIQRVKSRSAEKNPSEVLTLKAIGKAIIFGVRVWYGWTCMEHYAKSDVCEYY